MTVKVVYTSFIVLIIILFIVSIYFTSSLAYKKFSREKIKEKTGEILAHFEKALDEGLEDNSIHVKALGDNFSKKRDIKSFYLAYEEYVKRYGYSEELRDLLNGVVDYEKIMKSKIVKKSYRKTYTLYLISQFGLNAEGVGDFALEALGDDSIYVRNNALAVISNKGEIDIMIQALDKINLAKKYYNNRILIDFLDNFKGDVKKLDLAILERLEDYTERFKRLMVEHLASIENDDEKIRDKVLEFLINSKDNELLIKATRYFYPIVDERAAEYILKNISSDNWILRANSVHAISKYPSKRVVEKLKKSLGDPNYFVRKNSAISFVKIQDKEDLFYEAYYNEDLFAREILVYTMETMGVEGFGEYKAFRDKEDNFIEDGSGDMESKLDNKSELGLGWG